MDFLSCSHDINIYNLQKQNGLLVYIYPKYHEKITK